LKSSKSPTPKWKCGTRALVVEALALRSLGGSAFGSLALHGAMPIEDEDWR
jgi:hypothetical protein